MTHPSPVIPRLRGRWQALKDFATFPFRAVALFGGDRWGLSALSSERFDYVAREVTGYCLDVGCGRRNRFVGEYLGGNGLGVDVYPYEGLDPEQVLPSLTSLPFADATFDAVTFIACLNHVPEPDRDAELAEAWRVLRPGGVIVVTMGHPIAEIVVHRLLQLYDRVLGTRFDVDSERGMHHEESFYLHDSEIRSRLQRAGFRSFRRRHFPTQWMLNHLIVGTKPNRGAERGE